MADDDLEQVPGKLAAALAADGAPVVLVLDNLHEVTELAPTKLGIALRENSRDRPFRGGVHGREPNTAPR